MHLLKLAKQQALPDKLYEYAWGQEFTAGADDSLCLCWEQPGKAFPGADAQHLHQNQRDKVGVGVGWRGLPFWLGCRKLKVTIAFALIISCKLQNHRLKNPSEC